MNKNQEEIKKEVDTIFNLAESRNPDYFMKLDKNIRAFLEYNKIEVYCFKDRPAGVRAGFYMDKDGYIVHHRFHKEVSLEEDEPDGYWLEMAIKGHWDAFIPDWVYELMDRLAWSKWPDDEYEPVGFGEKIEPTHCWHHRSISWYNVFSSVAITNIRLEIGLCYCS